MTTDAAAVALAGKVATDLPCTGCGYNLRGVPLDAACPECGTAVAVTRTGRRELTRRDVVTFGVRLIAVWLLLTSLGTIETLLWWVSQLLGFDPFGGGSIGLDAAVIALLQFVPLVIHFGIAVVVWILASAIARFIVPRDAPVGHIGRISTRGLIRAGAALMGIWFAVTALEQLIGIATLPLFESDDGAIHDAYIAFSEGSQTIGGSIFRLAVGIALYLGRDRLAETIAWARRVGTRPHRPWP